MQFLKERASTQQNDYTGFVAIDGHRGAVLLQICKDKEVNGKYFPIGFGLYDADNQEGETLLDDRTILLNLYVVDTEKEQIENSFDAVAAYIRSNNKVAKITTIRISLTYNELGKYFKRLGMAVIQKGFENIISDFEENNE